MSSITTKIKLVLLGILLSGMLNPSITMAQFYERGQDPAFIKWKQIRTNNFQIIFPESYTSEAQRLSNILEYAYNYVSFSLKNKPRKISVIIHNYSVRFNGFVAWAPKRMELYPTPSQNLYPQDVLEQLALHELRHVVQVDKLYQGITRILSYAFGEMAPGAIAGMLPIWYLEGDAVATETALSNTGRGRLPGFEMKLRSLSLEQGQVYKYDKAYLGSYKDYVPNYYEYGYQMIAYSRQKYGSRWWDKSLNYVARNPYLINPIHFSLYNNLGLNKRRLYDATFRELNHLWKENTRALRYTEYDTVNVRKNDLYTSYRFPQYLNDSIIIAEKSSIDKISRFVAIDQDGNETVLHKPGFYDPVRLSVTNDRIVWAEIIPDIRWSNREFSVIKSFNIKTGLETMITRRTRYFSPVLSPDGSRIATVEVSIENQVSLIILNARNGQVLERIPVPGKKHLLMPAWMPDGKSVVVILLDENGKSIQKIILGSHQMVKLTDPDFDDILHVSPNGKYLFFHATYSGIDNIYALDTLSLEKFQVTSSRYGAFDVCLSPNGEKIAYSDYGSNGFNLAEITLDESQFRDPGKAFLNRVKWDEVLASQEAEVMKSEDIPGKKYEVKPYRKLFNNFQFHSWAPFYTDLNQLDLESLQILPGIMFFSQNKLSTTTSTVGYAYEDNEHHIYSKLTYKGLFPVFDLSLNYGGLPPVIPDSLIVTSKDLSLESQVYLPFNLTTNRFIRGIYPSFEAGFRNLNIHNEQSDQVEKGLWTLRYRLYLYNYMKLAHRDIQPRWGQVFDLILTQKPFNMQNNGNMYTLRTILYFPGILQNHGIKISGGIEKQRPERILYSNILTFPRGYGSYISGIAENLRNASIEYHMPLFYPDLNISSIAYFKRIRATIFYDYAHGNLFDFSSSTFHPDRDLFTSTGGSLVVDSHLLRIRFPISLGLEYAYLPQLKTYDLSIIFNLDVFGFNINRLQF